MNKEVKQILKITNDMLKIPSVIKHEKQFLDYLEKKIKKLGYKTIRNSKYLIVKQNNSKYLFSAHIDRHGLIKNNNNEFEYAAYYYKKKLNLKFHRDTLDFYLSCAQRHTNDKLISEKGKKYKTTRYNLDWKNKLVTYDLDKKTKNEKVLGFNSKVIIDNNLFFGQIDNVISVAVLFYLLKKKELNHDIIFTTKEEIGQSYKCVLNYLKDKKNNSLVVLDTTPYENFSGKKNGFIVLREGDENGLFDKTQVKKLKKFVKDKNIPHYFKPKDTGMTELGRISTESKGKINGVTLQIPTMNYHTTYETSTVESLENYLKLIRLL